MKCLGLNTKLLESCGASTPADTLYIIYIELKIYFLEAHSKNNNRECWFSFFAEANFQGYHIIYWQAVPIEYFCAAVRKLLASYICCPTPFVMCPSNKFFFSKGCKLWSVQANMSCNIGGLLIDFLMSKLALTC